MQSLRPSLPRFLLPRLSWTDARVELCAPWSLRQLPAFPGTAKRSIATAAIASAVPWSSNIHAQTGGTPRRRGRPQPQPQPQPGIASMAHALSMPTAALPPAALSRRSFHASAMMRRDHHFDTLKFVQRLQGEGFTEEQAVAMMKVLDDAIEESIQSLTRTMVLREDAAKAMYTQKVDFAKLRSELLSADSTEGNTTKTAHERLANEIAKFNSRLRDDVGRTQASVRLDLNLEKGRIREEAVGQELKVKETETKIEQEVAALRQQLEQVKFQTLQWLMGVCTGFAALMLGAWRLLM
ncbi:mitochondrial protein [Grosmannia clavigera kw1407]|uniref:Mitochondrial protein n=1 Tax=Grosmannia clavigera (strain kw1407 / UAMH 11150) TaxID=655863 RepID=F0XS07_GROCL|nr:mitochondrial protein [Grosmannia clavigera kw1407]EFW99395.1 mitochondrial protein [Grosmannia clavigera kw1407]